jgi:hypothetical protein
MPNKVLLKKSSVAAKVPVAADLDYGEIALNYQDGKIYYKKADNSIDSFTSASAVTGVSSVAGNTGVVTANQLLTAINTVDGSGSGLDADLLDGINGASLIRSDTADTFLNITSENGIESLKVGGYTTTAAIQASYSTSFAAQPMSTQIWHDLLAFSKNYTTTYETYNGTTWSSATVNKELFAQKENQTVQITNGTTITRARWTFTDVGYSSADWLVIGHTWNTPTPNKTILVESSPDGVTWYTKHNSTYDNIAVTMFHKLDPYYGDSRLRITITWNSGGDVRLSNIKLLTCRPGDQGRGVEDEFPYTADGNQNIITGGNLTIGAGKTLSSPTAIVSTLATGTAPFTVASTTKVNNLNADQLDGLDSSNFLSFSEPHGSNWVVGGLGTQFGSYHNNAASSGYISFGVAGANNLSLIIDGEYYANASIANKVWHAGNDGVASGLDADLLDGQQGSYYLDTSATAQTKTGDLTITGNLTVNGTTVTINSTTLTVDDKNIELGSIASPTDTTADGGGITLKGATDKTFNWVQSTGYWTANNSISAPRLISTVATGTSPLVVASTTLVSNLNADLLDGLNSSSFLRNDVLNQEVLSYLTINTDNGFAVLEFEDASNVTRAHVYHATASNYLGIGVFDAAGANRKDLVLNQNGTITWNNNTVWHAGNDGTGSGLDADLLGGVASSSYVTLTGTQTLTNKTFTGNVNVNNSLKINSLDGYFTVQQNNSAWTTSTDHPIIKWNYNATYDDHLYLASGGNQAVSSQAVLVISENSGLLFGLGSSASVTTLGTKYFQITNTGNVGIGNITTTPSTRLQVGVKVADDNSYTYDGNSLYVVHQTATGTAILNDPKEVLLLARQGTGGQAYGAAASFRLSRYENNGVNSRTRLDLVLAHDSFLGSPATVLTARSDGNIGIGTTAPAYKLQVNGSFAATTKSFVIDHPTKPDMKLRYGSLEGPENGVYVRGRLKNNKIELPDYWTKLVDPESITVSLTSVGKHQDLYVKSIENNTITVANSNLVAKGIDCFYVVYGERCDVDKLQVEIAN